MMRATLYHFRGEPHEPLRLTVPKPTDDGYASVRFRQHHVEFSIDTNDPAWLEELESAIRQAREGLERRQLRVAS